jgi:hypothetical protein
VPAAGEVFRAVKVTDSRTEVQPRCCPCGGGGTARNAKLIADDLMPLDGRQGSMKAGDTARNITPSSYPKPGQDAARSSRSILVREGVTFRLFDNSPGIR